MNNHRRFIVEYLDVWDNVQQREHLAKRFFVDTQGALLIIDFDENVTHAYANKVWRTVT